MSRYARLLCVVIFALLAFGRQGRPARADDVRVTKFFTVSAADAYPFYHSRVAGPPSPSNTRVFPSQVPAVYFYYAYSGASPAFTYFQVMLYDNSGNLLTQDKVYAADRIAGQFMNSFSSFSDGAYRLVLYADGAEASSTEFTVGLGVGLLAFDTISRAAFNAMSSSQGMPPRTVSFPAGASVCVAVDFQGATAGAPYVITLYDHTGKVRHIADETFSDSAGIEADSFSGIDPGDYFLGLQVDGSTIAITNFSVERSPVVITTFYTLPGTASFSGPPPRSSRYGAGTTVINYYFRFRGIASAKLKYSISIVDPAGVNLLVDNSGSSRISHDDSATSGWIIDSVSLQRPFPPGAYALDLRVNGVRLASTAFMVT